jgi:L-fucose mutarotase/ribose pyranase (RbsD/FucU family)
MGMITLRYKLNEEMIVVALQLQYEQMVDLLTELLDCGSCDLRIIGDSEYPMDILIEWCRDNLGSDKITINDLAYAMFMIALDDVQEAIEEKMEQMADDLENGLVGELGKAKIEEIVDSQLSIRDDVETFHNYMDTHAYLINNQEIYQEYFKDELDIFETKTGYSLNG